VSGGGEFNFLSPHHYKLTKELGETIMDEHFVQGIVGGVLNRHKGRTLDEKRIQTLMVEIAANIDVASQYTNVKGLAKDNPLSIEMWKGYKPNKVEEEKLSKEYLEYWTCDLCGKNTHEVDYDYLGNGTNHLQCELKLEYGEEE
jgi:hypothetical protein